MSRGHLKRETSCTIMPLLPNGDIMEQAEISTVQPISAFDIFIGWRVSR